MRKYADRSPSETRTVPAGRFNDFARFDAFQLRIGQPGEQRSGTDLLESGLVHSYKRPRYSWTSFTAMAPSPTPEVTPLADR